MANIGIDNATVVQKGNQIIHHLRRRAKESRQDPDGTKVLGGKTSHLHKESPFKQIWALMKDGDLWQLFTDLVLQRGPETVVITKVKGHATDDMVKEGKVQPADKEGIKSQQPLGVRPPYDLRF